MDMYRVGTMLFAPLSTFNFLQAVMLAGWCPSEKWPIWFHSDEYGSRQMMTDIRQNSPHRYRRLKPVHYLQQLNVHDFKSTYHLIYSCLYVYHTKLHLYIPWLNHHLPCIGIQVFLRYQLLVSYFIPGYRDQHYYCSLPLRYYSFY